MVNVELVQAEVAVIEAGIVLARIKVGLVESEIKRLRNVAADIDLMSARVPAVEVMVSAVKEDVEMVEAKAKLFRSEPVSTIARAEALSSALRSHIELDNDKLAVAMRELEQIERDIFHPRFAIA